MQQGYFDQCNDIISNLEETLSALQLTVSDLHAWAFGSGQSDDDSNPKKVAPYVPSRLMQNLLIDALEHATAILSDANEVQIFMMGGEYEGAPDDWVDSLSFTDSAEAQAESKGELPIGAYGFSLMKFDPATGEKDPIPNEAKHYRNFHGDVAWIYNPYSGEKRDPRDIGSDVLGFGIIAGAHNKEEPVKQAKPEALEAVEVARKIVDVSNVIMIGAHVVPAPMKRKPSLGATFYCPTPDREEMVIEDIWIASIRNIMMFDAGWLHATKEAAIAHAKALIAVSKEG